MRHYGTRLKTNIVKIITNSHRKSWKLNEVDDAYLLQSTISKQDPKDPDSLNCKLENADFKLVNCTPNQVKLLLWMLTLNTSRIDARSTHAELRKRNTCFRRWLECYWSGRHDFEHLNYNEMMNQWRLETCIQCIQTRLLEDRFRSFD